MPGHFIVDIRLNKSLKDIVLFVFCNTDPRILDIEFDHIIFFNIAEFYFAAVSVFNGIFYKISEDAE